MAALIGLFAGALVGHLLWQDWGAALGGIAGFFAGVRFSAWRARSGASRAAVAPRGPAASMQREVGRAQPGQDATLARRVEELERRVASLEREANRHLEPDVPVPYSKEAAAVAHPELRAATEEPEAIAPLLETPAPAPPAPSPGASAVRASPPAPRANPFWAWFTGGNALTRIGVVIMFFGVAFLLKYFAEHFTVSIELRLAAVAGFAVALIVLGLRLAAARPAYGLSLQGAGAGILYLTIYAAFRLYGVLPEAPAIVLLVVVAALTIGLAVRADSQPLAALAIAGGFLAPVLVGNDGDPLLLFGYFAVLNAAIFALAWSKSWRALNAVGFVFTFVLGSAWGREFYDAAHYAIVQPFLALFFVFYVGIAILNVRRAPPTTRDPVDGLLVFGVPLAGFALQAALVHEYHHGVAWSAVAIAAFYAVFFVATRKRAEPGYPLLARAFAALAVIFATVAIPFAFDDRYTAAIWAVEAAGVYWIGVRQNVPFARAFALLVEVGAGILFAISGPPAAGDLLFANAYFAGAILIAAAGLVTACIADRAANLLGAGERALTPAVFGWGVLWWLAAGSVELVRHLPRAEEPHAVLAWVTASVALALVASRWLAWPRLTGAALVMLPAMAVVAYFDFELNRTTLEMYGWIVWPCAWIVHWRALAAAEPMRVAAIGAKYEAVDIGELLGITHAISALALTVQVAWEASEWTGRVDRPLHGVDALRGRIAGHRVPVARRALAGQPALAFRGSSARLRGRGGRADGCAGDDLVPGGQRALSRRRVAVAVRAAREPAGCHAGARVVGDRRVGGALCRDPAARTVPVACPRALRRAQWPRASHRASLGRCALAAFVHAGVEAAAGGTDARVDAHGGRRDGGGILAAVANPLDAGAALLAVVVAKLFLVDLGSLSGLPRVIAFLGVGVLLLIIGFVSPLPPAAPEEVPGN